MADRISRNRETLSEIFKKIVTIDCYEDGVYFDEENIKTEPITVDKKSEKDKVERRHPVLHCHANHQKTSSAYGNKILGGKMNHTHILVYVTFNLPATEFCYSKDKPYLCRRITKGN